MNHDLLILREARELLQRATLRLSINSDGGKRFFLAKMQTDKFIPLGGLIDVSPGKSSRFSVFQGSLDKRNLCLNCEAYGTGYVLSRPDGDDFVVPAPVLGFGYPDQPPAVWQQVWFVPGLSFGSEPLQRIGDYQGVHILWAGLEYSR